MGARGGGSAAFACRCTHRFICMCSTAVGQHGAGGRGDDFRRRLTADQPWHSLAAAAETSVVARCLVCLLAASDGPQTHWTTAVIGLSTHLFTGCSRLLQVPEATREARVSDISKQMQQHCL